MKNKYIYLILSALIALTACQDELAISPDTFPSATITTTHTGKARVAVSSREELKNIIDQMEYADEPMSRVASGVQPGVGFIPFDKEGDSIFTSLVEANRQAVMSTLTDAQLEEIRNDEDELEFCPEDSVIADIRFAMLLNKDREIQVGDTIFRYFANGVAYTLACHQSELDSLKDLIPTLEFDPNDPNQAHPTVIPGSNVEFKPLYLSTTRDVTIVDNGGQILTEDDYKELSEIPARDIRDIYYTPENWKHATDGNWFHKTWSGFWGENVTAIKKFASNKKLTLNFYDQNYLIYASIGTSLKMQKRVLGIWWNIKAEKMVQGWETVTIRHKKPNPIPLETFTHPTWQNPTISMQNPFGTSQKVLFYIPFADCPITTQDLTAAYKAATQWAYNHASDWAKKNAKSANNIGLFSVNGNEAFVVHGPAKYCASNVKSLNSKFHFKMFSGTFRLDFSSKSSSFIKTITLDTDDGVDLYAGRVYGAIKYKGKWLAARITKHR